MNFLKMLPMRGFQIFGTKISLPLIPFSTRVWSLPLQAVLAMSKLVAAAGAERGSQGPRLPDARSLRLGRRRPRRGCTCAARPPAQVCAIRRDWAIPDQARPGIALGEGATCCFCNSARLWQDLHSVCLHCSYDYRNRDLPRSSRLPPVLKKPSEGPKSKTVKYRTTRNGTRSRCFSW